MSPVMCDGVTLTLGEISERSSMLLTSTWDKTPAVAEPPISMV